MLVARRGNGCKPRNIKAICRNLLLAVLINSFILFFLVSPRVRTRLYLTYRTLWSYGINRMDKSMPPVYLDIRAADARLPQHNMSLPFPEGKNGRYIRFSNQIWGLGLNNQLQETLLNAHISHLSQRAYVFTPIIHDRSTPLLYSPIDDNTNLAPSDSHYRASRTPRRAFLRGPDAGGPWPPGDPSPRAVTEAWWNKVCPSSRRVIVDTETVNSQLGVDFERDEGITIVRKWSQYLKDLEAPCVSIQHDKPRIIDFGLLGSPRLLSLWPSLTKSPVFTHFAWSPIVYAGVERNLRTLLLLQLKSGSPSDGAAGVLSQKVIHNMVSIHVRRADYEGHCRGIAGFALFEGWNALPDLPDRFAYPSDSTDDWDRRKAFFMPHCWVEIPDIVNRLHKLREEHADTTPDSATPLDTVFVSTNGDRTWIKALRSALIADGWRNVIGTSDLQLTWEESGVDSAIGTPQKPSYANVKSFS